jgi:ribonuclease Z
VRISVLGSGDAFSGCGCNAAYLVDSALLVDCGAPVHVQSRRIAASIADIRVILLTHFHADHTFMLPQLVGARALAEHDIQPGLIIAGPVGTREYARRLVADGYGHHIQHLIDERLQPVHVDLQDGSDQVLAGYRVRAHAVVHSVGPSLAYSVSDESGATIGFSGDSTLCAGLRRAVDGSDLFVCECSGWDGPVPGGHLWRDEVAELVAAYPQTTFLLSHLAERRTLPGALTAHDLLTLEVNALASQ